MVEKLAALVRIADGLDRSHRQLVTGVSCRIRSRRVELEISSRGDCEAELTAARKKSRLFEKVFDRKVILTAVPAERGEKLQQRNLEMISAEALWG